MNEVCRFCTLNCTTLENIFAERERRNNEPLLSVMLESCTDCDIREADLLPQNICGPCISIANIAFEFKQKSQQSQKYFTELLSQHDRKPDTEELETAEWCITEVTTNEGCIKTEPDDTLGTKGTIETVNDDGTEVESSTTDETYEPNVSCENKATKTGNRPYKCEQCPSDFKSRNGLKHHLMVHSDERPFKCKQCPYSSFTQFRLTRHLSFHSDTHPYKCEPCAVAFQSDSILKRHMKLTHKQEKYVEGPPFKCEHCPNSFRTLNFLKWHLFNHSDKNPHKCKQCSYSSTTPAMLTRHLSFHSDTHPYKCEPCAVAFQRHFALKMHMEAIHTEETIKQDDQLKCMHCTYVSTTQAMLTRHLLIHLRTHPYKCEHCSFGFQTDYNLQRHKRLIHKKLQRIRNAKKAHKCPECFKRFETHIGLNIHLTTHKKKPKFKCLHCPKMFGREMIFLRHVKRVHEKQSMHVCPFCSKSFKSRKNLIEHKLQHTEKRPYKCEQCPSDFKTRDGLKNHLMVHSDKPPFKCKQCPYSSNTQFMLTRHSLIHSDTHPHKCEHCSFGFQTDYNLQRHKRLVHKEVETYNCDQCPYSCNSDHNLKKHLKIHSDTHPYICEQCSGAFQKRPNLMKHIRRVHKKIDRK